MAATRILPGAALAAALLGAAGNAAAVPVSAATTAEPAHVRGTIVSVHGDVLDLRLGHEQAIKRIGVVAGQGGGTQRMRDLDG